MSALQWIYKLLALQASTVQTLWSNGSPLCSAMFLTAVCVSVVVILVSGGDLWESVSCLRSCWWSLMSYGLCDTWVLSLCVRLPYFLFFFCWDLVWRTNCDEVFYGTKACPLVCHSQVQLWMFNSHLSFLSGSLFYECKYKRNDTNMYNIVHMQSFMTAATPKTLKILFKMTKVKLAHTNCISLCLVWNEAFLSHTTWSEYLMG